MLWCILKNFHTGIHCSTRELGESGSSSPTLLQQDPDPGAAAGHLWAYGPHPLVTGIYFLYRKYLFSLKAKRSVTRFVFPHSKFFVKLTCFFCHGAFEWDERNFSQNVRDWILEVCLYPPRCSTLLSHCPPAPLTQHSINQGQGNFLKVIKGIYQTPTANIYSERMGASPKVREQPGMSSLAFPLSAIPEVLSGAIGQERSMKEDRLQREQENSLLTDDMIYI